MLQPVTSVNQALVSFFQSDMPHWRHKGTTQVSRPKCLYDAQVVAKKFFIILVPANGIRTHDDRIFSKDDVTGFDWPFRNHVPIDLKHVQIIGTYVDNQLRQVVVCSENDSYEYFSYI